MEDGKTLKARFAAAQAMQTIKENIDIIVRNTRVDRPEVYVEYLWKLRGAVDKALGIPLAERLGLDARGMDEWMTVKGKMDE